MEEEKDQLEVLWERLLSRQVELVRAAYAELEAGDQQAVLAHLQRMSTESGWHPEQRKSAQAALLALDSRLTKSP